MFLSDLPVFGGFKSSINLVVFTVSKHEINISFSENSREHGVNLPDVIPRFQSVLEITFCHRIPSSTPSSFSSQQYSSFKMPIRGPSYGWILGIRSLTLTSHISSPYGAFPPHGSTRLRQNIPVLLEGDQHDVCGWPHHSYSC